MKTTKHDQNQKANINPKRRKHQQGPGQVLSRILQIDYRQAVRPQSLSQSQLQTYGCLTQAQIKQVMSKLISRQILQRIIIDSMKMCYLYSPIMQAIETQMYSCRDQYRVKGVLELIFRGKFYQFLKLKTQPAKHLVNNRSTQINIKTIISGILTYFGSKLTIQNISDLILFYRLEEALYQTAPHGLPFEFQIIVKAMKKIDRNITADKFNAWEKNINTIEKALKYLQPYHFVYLISLSEPLSKKKTNIFQVDKKQCKFQKQTEIMSIIKQKNTFIDLEKRKKHWRNDIKIRGLSFQGSPQIERIESIKKEFKDLRKKIISHKRVKSADIMNEAKTLVDKDLKQWRQKQNQHFLEAFFMKKNDSQVQRKLLKKHRKSSQAKRQFQFRKQNQKSQFRTFYSRQLQDHLGQQHKEDGVLNKRNKTSNLGHSFKNTSQARTPKRVGTSQHTSPFITQNKSHPAKLQDQFQVIDNCSHPLVRVPSNDNSRVSFL